MPPEPEHSLQQEQHIAFILQRTHGNWPCWRSGDGVTDEQHQGEAESPAAETRPFLPFLGHGHP